MFSAISWTLRRTVRTWLRRIPAPRKEIRNGGRANHKRAIVPTIDPVLRRRAEVLIPADMKRQRFSYEPQRIRPRRLGPAIRIVIGDIDLAFGISAHA